MPGGVLDVVLQQVVVDELKVAGVLKHGAVLLPGVGGVSPKHNMDIIGRLFKK